MGMCMSSDGTTEEDSTTEYMFILENCMVVYSKLLFRSLVKR